MTRYLRYKYLALLLCMFAVVARSDQPPGLRDYVGIVLSPSNHSYAVQVVQSWDYAQAKSGTKWMTGRFQVFETRTGKLQWEITEILCPLEDVFLIETDYVVTIKRNCSYSPSKPKNPKEEGFEAPVICFYCRGKMIATYSLDQLDFETTRLKVTATHYSFYEPVRAQKFWDLKEYTSIEAINKAEKIHGAQFNPGFQGKKMSLKFFDQRTRVFDYTTGKLLEVNGLSQGQGPEKVENTNEAGKQPGGSVDAK